MINRKLSIGAGTLGIAVAAALAPVAPAWAGSHKHHKTKATATATGVAECPSAASLSTAASVTYTGPTTEQAAEKDWVVCEYCTQQDGVSLLVSTYTKGFPLRGGQWHRRRPNHQDLGIGNAASHFGNIVYVQRNSAPSFSVIDQTGNLTLSQVEAEAKSIVAG
jgi:hypothetical protein